MAARGMGLPSTPASSMPMTPLVSTTRGRHARGMSSMASSSSSQSCFSRLKSMVRLALVASVTWGRPSTRCQARKLSTVPKHSSPRFARSCRCRLSSSQASFVPEKYASGTRPVFSRMISAMPSRFSRSMYSAVRRHCQTMALYTHSPVSRSHSRVVSRWLVSPTAAMSATFTPLMATACRSA